MINLNSILQEGYAVVAGRVCAAGSPRLSLGELQALIAFCSAEMDRIEQSDAEIRNVYGANKEITQATSELISAFQRIDTACKIIEVEKRAGWLAA